MTTTDEAAVAISDEEVRKLLPALSEAERATEATAERFVPPRPGILEEASARRHQLVFGRRGVGKSTLLHRVAAGGRESGRAVIFIDDETLRRRPYPDVLIEPLKELFDHLDERLREDGWSSGGDAGFSVACGNLPTHASVRRRGEATPSETSNLSSIGLAEAA
jgi:hypothetical protein